VCVGQGGRAKSGLGILLLQAGIQGFDLGFQRRDLIIQGTSAVGNGIGLFSKPRHEGKAI
ncbi:MAG: hypothetical protein ACREIC_02495, partial [Limisphaerales bacterium]